MYRKIVVPFLPILLLLAGCQGALDISGLQDDTPPVVLSTYPAAGVVDAAKNTGVCVQFDDTIDPTSVFSSAQTNFYVTRQGDTARIPVEMSLEDSGKKLLIRRKGAQTNFFTVGQTYTATLVGGGLVKNIAQLAWASPTDLTWDFTVVDRLESPRPVIVFTAPLVTDAIHYVRDYYLTVSGFAQDQLGRVARQYAAQYQVKSGDWLDPVWATDFSFPLDLNLPIWNLGGTNLLYVKAVCKGNGADDPEVSVTNSFRFVIDRTAPVCAIDSPTASQVVKGMVTVTGTIADQHPLRKVELTIAGVTAGWTNLGSGKTCSFTFDSRVLTDGAFTAQVRATDLAGNISSVASRQFFVRNWDPVQVASGNVTEARSFDFTLVSGTENGVFAKTTDDKQYWNNTSIPAWPAGVAYPDLAASGAAIHFVAENGTAIAYAKYDGAAWSTMATALSSTSRLFSPQVATAANGDPMTSYLDHFGESYASLRITRNNSSMASTVPASLSHAIDAKLAFVTSSGMAHFLVREYYGGVKYLSFDFNTGTLVSSRTHYSLYWGTTDRTANANSSAICLDPTDAPHMVFRTLDNQLYYADATTASAIPGLPGSGALGGVSITVVDGKIHLAFLRGTTLYYAYRDVAGGSWTFRTVCTVAGANAKFTRITARLVGADPEIRIFCAMNGAQLLRYTATSY